MNRLLIPFAVVAVLAGCKSTPPDYTRQLRPGQSALVRVRGGENIPDPAKAYRMRDRGLLEAIDKSLGWFKAPSSKKYFPFERIVTHEQAEASLVAFRSILVNSRDAFEFREELWRLFTIYRSVGWNGEGTVLYTGYYAPEFPASRTRTSRFRYPLYKRPADLVTDPDTGEPRGRKFENGTVGPYPTRKEIEQSGMLQGTELVWLEDPLSAYIVHVNGSAKLNMMDGTVLHVGYNGKTDREYSGLGGALVEAGLIRPERLGLPAVRDAYRRHPDRVVELMYENESYVFFTEYDGGNWPAGSLGVRVTGRSSLATDKRIYPRGGVVMVNTTIFPPSGRKQEFVRFMLDQDTGGAIRAPGRADIFMGVGSQAEQVAGRQYAEGTLFYFILRPQYVSRFRPEETGER
jgi:membrane-bound lytic murein transglycosylase A